MVLDNARLSDFIRKEQPVEVWLGYARDPYLWDKSELAPRVQRRGGRGAAQLGRRHAPSRSAAATTRAS
jgi:hypothetical protein